MLRLNIHFGEAVMMMYKQFDGSLLTAKGPFQKMFIGCMLLQTIFGYRCTCILFLASGDLLSADNVCRVWTQIGTDNMLVLIWF